MVIRISIEYMATRIPTPSPLPFTSRNFVHGEVSFELK